MGLKSYFVKRMIDLDLIPCRTRWRKSVRGIGRIHANTYIKLRERYGPEGTRLLGQVMYGLGSEQAMDIVDSLGLTRDLEGCAYAVMVMHRIFGIKSKIAQRDEEEVVIEISHCEWGRRTGGWIPEMCASIGRYEDGVIETILPEARHSYESRHTLGNETCRLVITQA
jgi:hypothetical protein